MQPVQLVLDRIEARRTGTDRWRAACPVCGEGNRSTLSIGIGVGGGVLLHCFKAECPVDEIVDALGLKLEDLFPVDQSDVRHCDQNGRPRHRRAARLLSAQQALDLMADEVNFVFVAAANLAAGVALTNVDRTRCAAAAARIEYLRTEARV